MIRLQSVCKTFYVGNQPKVVADNITLTLHKRTCLGLLGRNGAGKSTLMEMISGAMAPDSGKVERFGTVSWPVGFAGAFHPELTGQQNVRFVARVYGIETDELCDFVADFAQLGPHFKMPVRTYSAGMKSRLSFGVSMGVPFDTYLLDEVTSVGGRRCRLQGSLIRCAARAAGGQQRHSDHPFDAQNPRAVQCCGRAGEW